MAEISIDAAVGSGFGLIRRKPLTVLIWGLAQAAAMVPFLGAYAVFLLTLLPLAATQQVAAQPTAGEVGEIVGRMLLAEGCFFLGIILMLCVRTIVLTATWRAVLHPDQHRWAYLRVGRAEGFILLLFLCLAFAGNLIVLPLLPVLMIAGALAAMRLWVAAVAVGAVGIIAMIVAVIYLELRFSVVGPMIVSDNKFHFLEAWTLTKGKAGSLFLIGLCILAILMGAEMLIFLLGLGIGAAGLGAAAGGFDQLQAFFQSPPAAILAKLAPLLVVYAVAAIPIAGAFTAILGAPWARAYRDLAPPEAAAVA
jgi:hypothetical protein